MENKNFKEEKSENIIYSLGVIVLAKIISSIIKSDTVREKQVHNERSSDESIFEVIFVEDKIDLTSPVEKPKELGKNRFLHYADDFGVMEKGTVE